jgi:hypothetical protein
MKTTTKCLLIIAGHRALMVDEDTGEVYEEFSINGTFQERVLKYLGENNIVVVNKQTFTFL